MVDPGIVRTRSTLQERLLAENPFKGPFESQRDQQVALKGGSGNRRSSIDLGSKKPGIQIWPVESRVRDEKDARLDPMTHR